MDRQSTTISTLADIEADLVYLAPMAERPHSYTYDPPPGMPRTNTVNALHRMTVHDARPFAGDLSLDREGLELVQHRSAACDGRSRFAPHGAFEDPTAPADMLPRESIELRTLVFHSA